MARLDLELMLRGVLTKMTMFLKGRRQSYKSQEQQAQAGLQQLESKSVPDGQDTRDYHGLYTEPMHDALQHIDPNDPSHMELLELYEQESFELYFMLDGLRRFEDADSNANATLKMFESLASLEPAQLAAVTGSAAWFLGKTNPSTVIKAFAYLKQKSGSVEVAMAGNCFRLAFRIPDVCVRLQALPKFVEQATQVTPIVLYI